MAMTMAVPRVLMVMMVLIVSILVFVDFKELCEGVGGPHNDVACLVCTRNDLQDHKHTYWT
jgi:hypothetical protein